MFTAQDGPPPGPGSLYIVATPIGNLEDITLRAVKVLNQVSLIAAEDTRRTKKLLHAYHIETPVTSLYEHNEFKKSPALVAKIIEGVDIAYVSDAGTPGISDPGYLLVQEAIASGVSVIPIPGPCALIAALSASGLPADSFMFTGFLPARSGKRRQFIKSLEKETKTIVFYESPARLLATLEDLRDILGDRLVVMSRELTKIYEEISRGTLTEVIGSWRDRKVKGEITVIVSGGEKKKQPPTEEDLDRLIAGYKEDASLSERDVIDTISRELGISRRLVYEKVIKARG